MSAPQLVPPFHEALWSRAADVLAAEFSFHTETIKLMREAIDKVGAAGLAAPQLGIPLRFFVTAKPVFESERVVFNPTYRPVGENFISKPERCLSYPSFSTFVRRPEKIYACWVNEEGFSRSALMEGMDARIYMHLADILDGTQIFPRPRASVVTT